MSKAAPVIKPVVDWPVRTVGEATTLLRRGTAPTYVDESSVLAIGQRCITDSGFDGSRARPHSSRAMWKVIHPESNDVLINSTGTGTIGRSAIFRGQGDQYIVDSHVTVARPKTTEIVGRWLHEVIRSPDGQRYLTAECYAGSTNQVELSASALAALPIAAPSIDEQGRVARVLDLLDKQIALSTNLVAKLESLHDGLLLKSFGDDAGKSIPLDGIVGKERPIVYGILMPGRHVPGGVPVVKVRNMKEGTVYREELLQTAPAIDREYRRSRLRAGDILLSIRGTIGRVCVIPPELDGANITQDSARIAVSPTLRSYIAHYLTSPRAQRLIDSETVGLAVRGINLRDVRRIDVPMTTDARIKSVADALDASQSNLRLVRQRLLKLRQAKQGVVADLLSGRVRVPEGATS
jgi:type I restriction enzyme S subunit